MVASANDRRLMVNFSETRCIATQAALKASLKGPQGAPFAAADRFHYRGARRSIVSWDESFAFNRPVTLDGELIFSKAALKRHAEPGEVVALVRERIGPAIERD